MIQFVAELHFDDSLSSLFIFLNIKIPGLSVSLATLQTDYSNTTHTKSPEQAQSNNGAFSFEFPMDMSQQFIKIFTPNFACAVHMIKTLMFVTL